MTTKERRKILAKEFRAWGKRSISRIERLTLKHGVLCTYNFTDGKRG